MITLTKSRRYRGSSLLMFVHSIHHLPNQIHRLSKPFLFLLKALFHPVELSENVQHSHHLDEGWGYVGLIPVPSLKSYSSPNVLFKIFTRL